MSHCAAQSDEVEGTKRLMYQQSELCISPAHFYFVDLN